MRKFRFSASVVGILLMKIAAVFAGQSFIGGNGNDPRTEADDVNESGDNITSENSVANANTLGGEEIIAKGDEFLIQGDFPDFPTTALETTKSFDRLPTPQVFVPPPQPETDV
jgi:hypothetical protein